MFTIIIIEVICTGQLVQSQWWWPVINNNQFHSYSIAGDTIAVAGHSLLITRTLAIRIDPNWSLTLRNENSSLADDHQMLAHKHRN